MSPKFLHVLAWCIIVFFAINLVACYIHNTPHACATGKTSHVPWPMTFIFLSAVAYLATN